MEMDGTLIDDVSLPTAVETIGTVNGGGGGGGGLFYPFFVFLIVLSFQALDAFLEILKKKGSNSNEQSQLRQEIKQLLKEASSLSTPSTFAQAAKLRRMAAAKEKELLKKQEEQNKDSKLSHDLYARGLLVLKGDCFLGELKILPLALRCYLNAGWDNSLAGSHLPSEQVPLPESLKVYFSEIDQRTLRDLNPTRTTSMNHKYICHVFFDWVTKEKGNSDSVGPFKDVVDAAWIKAHSNALADAILKRLSVNFCIFDSIIQC